MAQSQNKIGSQQTAPHGLVCLASESWQELEELWNSLQHKVRQICYRRTFTKTTNAHFSNYELLQFKNSF